MKQAGNNTFACQLFFCSLLSQEPSPHGEKQAAGQRFHCPVQVVRYRVTGPFSQGLVRVGTSCLSHGEGWFRIRTRLRFQISTRFKFKIGSRIQSGLKVAHFNSDGPFCPVKEETVALEALGGRGHLTFVTVLTSTGYAPSFVRTPSFSS